MNKRLVMRQGSSRVVILIGSLAFKFPHYATWRRFLAGLLANLTEQEWAGKDARLCPIRFAAPLGFLVVMDRCSPLGDVVSEEELRGMCIGIPSEAKQDSWGIHPDLGLVAIDFG